MAKTIHDLAVAYGKEHQGTVDIEIFEAGAKAVINKIVEAYNIRGIETMVDQINTLSQI